MSLQRYTFLLFLVTLVGCTPRPAIQNSEPITLAALTDFSVSDDNTYAPFYLHKDKQALAIDAAKYKDRFAFAETIFDGPAGSYEVSINTLGETDGESSYRLFVNGRKQGEVQNEATTVDYAPQILALGKVRLKAGDNIGIAFSSHSNGKIPEGDGFAFSRGRWTELVLK